MTYRSQGLRPPEPAGTGRSRLRRGARLALATWLLVQGPLSTGVIIVEGDCDLISAMESANSDRAIGGCPEGRGADLLVLTADVTLSYKNNEVEGGNGTPSVTSEISIDGKGFEVAREGGFTDAFRIFHVASSGTLTLTDLTVSGGDAVYSGGTTAGGGIMNRGDLRLIRSKVTENYAYGRGNGIYNAGDLEVIGGSIRDNGGDFDFFSRGALFNRGAALLVGTTISGNTAARDGAGVVNDDLGNLLILSSTLSDNTGVYGVGALGNLGGSATVVNSTISGNRGSFRSNALWNGTGDLEVVRSIVTDNRSGVDVPGAVVNDSGGVLTLRSTIVAANDDSDCAGAIEDGGSNFDGDGSCAGAAPIVSGVDFEADLEANGGPTETHALLPGSVAADAAGACGLHIDQRGFVRDEACDAGPYELGAEAAVPPGVAITGSCPGEVTVEVSGATPEGSVIVGRAFRPGATAIDAGLCAGSGLSLDDPKIFARLTADASGEAVVTEDLPSTVCGAGVVAFDLAKCAASAPVPVP